MLVICSAVDGSLHTAKDARRQKTIGSTVSVSDVRQQESETLLTLVGKSVCLQQRFSFVPSKKETVLHFRSQNKNYSCFVDNVLEQTERETKINTQTFSGGVQRASVHRRQEQKKSSPEVVFQKKTKSKNRCVTIRQPLVMYTMNLPDKHLSYEEASHILSSTEEAKVMLKRLLASTDHKHMMAESVSTGNVRSGKESQSRLLEKPEYLEGTYDYLFHRHVQTLNDVIQQQELQDDEARGIYQQKNHRQVIQLCCGEAFDCDDDASVTIGSTKSSSHHNTSPACYCAFSCDEATGNKNQDTIQNVHSNNFFANPNSCDDKVNDHCEEKESTSMNDNNQIGSCHCIQNKGDNSINLNPVTRKMNALKLQDVRSSSKPIITFNHVSTVNESNSTYTESESNKLKHIKTTSNSSIIRSRSSSPLLEVPVALEDLTTEMMRPPLN